MRVYIAGPYTHGNTEENVTQAIELADQVLVAGHEPFLPHLYHYWDKLFSHNYPTWTGLALHWLSFCDALIYLPGHSLGTQTEIDIARQLGIKVFNSLESFLQYYQNLDTDESRNSTLPGFPDPFLTLTSVMSSPPTLSPPSSLSPSPRSHPSMPSPAATTPTSRPSLWTLQSWLLWSIFLAIIWLILYVALG